MQLLRASCDCGFATRKARSGYHHHQWWFPLVFTESGTLSDVLAALPSDERDRIDQLSLDIYEQTPRDDQQARREASVRMERLSRDIHDKFIAGATEELRTRYAMIDSCVFDPAPGTVFGCPQCNDHSLVLRQVSVLAFCKADCGHEYQWLDSEMTGCPKCGYRPHRFGTEHEKQFAGQPRTICLCPCSSSTDSISHVDGYCPKCGELPDIYHMGGRAFCGVHREQMAPYRAPANFLFIETESQWAAHQFPNAKLWGDAPPDEQSISTSYCVLCEADHQRWLESHGESDD